MSHRWKVDLNAGSYYPDLASSLDGDDLGLGYENESETGMSFHAFSNHLDTLEAPASVSDRLLSLELLLNGALRLVYGAEIYFSHPVRFGDFWNLDTTQRYRRNSMLPEESPFENAVQSVAGGGTPAHPVAQLIALSRDDVGLRTLMFHAGLLSWPGHEGQLFAWGSLYKVFDTVRTLANERGLDPYKHVESAKINAFTGACNKMSVLGLSARHGLAVADPKAMKAATPTLEEATHNVMAMARVLLPAGCDYWPAPNVAEQVQFNSADLFDI